MKKKFTKVSLLIALLVLLFPAIALAVTYSYYSDIKIIEAGGNSYSYQPLISTVDINYLVDNHYIDSDGLDTELSMSGVPISYMLATDRVTFVVPSVLAYETLAVRFFMDHDPPQTNFDIIVGNNGYATTPDNSSIELGSNFTIEQKGYIDTSAGSDKNLVYKEDAFIIVVSDSGEITAVVYGSGSTSTSYDPEADGSINENALNGETVRWRAMQDDLDTSMLVNTGTSEKTDLFTNSSIYSDRNISDVINYVKVYWRSQENTSNCEGWASIYVGGTQYDGSTESYYSDWNWRNYQWDVNPADSEAWEISDLNGLEFGFTQEETTGSTAMTSETYVIIGYTPGVIVTATGVSSSDHKVNVTADGTNLKIYIDDVEEDSAALGGISVPDNSNSWYLMQNDCMPYMNYMKITVSILKLWYDPITIVVNTRYDGTVDSGTTTTLVDSELTQADDYWNLARLIIVTTTDHLAPEGENAVITDFTAVDDTLHFAALTAAPEVGDTYTVDFGTLIDRAGSNDGIITWGINPDNLSATFGNVIPYGQPIPGVTEAESPDIVSPRTSPGIFTESPGTNMPGYGFFKYVSDGSNIPIQVLWFGLCLMTVIGVGVVVWNFTNGNMIWTSITSGAALFIFTRMGDGLIPMWTLIVFGLVAAAVVLAQKVISV